MKWRMQDEFLSIIPAALAYIGVGVAGLSIIDDPQQRPWVAVLMVLFGVVFFSPDSLSRSNLAREVRIGILTALVAGLLIIQPGWSLFPILFFLIGPAAMSWFSLPVGLTWIGVFTLVTGIIFVYFEGWNGFVLLLPYAAGYLFFATFGWVRVQAVHDRRRSEQLLAELQQAHRQLQEYAARVEELTIAQERNRIAREVHDALGHRLTIAAVQLEGAQRLIYTDPERVDRMLGTVREQVKEGLADLRRTVAMLRASVEEDLPLQQALTKLAAQVQEATGLQVHLTIDETIPELPIAFRKAIYRATQEGLTNIQRHARASEAWIQLAQREGRVSLGVGDNGVGLPSDRSASGFGLSGLKERAAILGGDFYVDQRAGGGTQITFRLPVPEEPHDE